jgi:DNA repair photolyase
MSERNPIYRTIKKAMKRDLLPDPYFVAKYHFSPYMACEHACVYCDGRAEKYYVEGDYEKDIVVRRNILDIVRKELPKLREPGKISIGSGVSDVYQPIEEKESLMRRSAELLLEYQFGVIVLTKSSLIERDLDLWEKVNRKSQFVLIMSMITLNDKLRSEFEPGSSSIQSRLATLKKFKQAGMIIGVLAMPVLPFLTDSAEQVTGLLAELQSVPVDFVLPGILTLRPGRQKDYYLNRIEKTHPHLRSKYENLYRKNLQSGSSDFVYRSKKMTEINQLIKQANLLTTQPFAAFRHHFPLYDEIFILLSHLKELYSDKSQNLTRLNNAIKRYEEFLMARKKKFFQSRSLSYQFLENQIFEMFANGEMYHLLQNEKLTHFLSEIFVNNRDFDYHTLQLKDRNE